MKKFAKKFMPIDQAFTSVELLGRDPEDSRIIILDGQICDHRTATYDCSVVSEYSEEFLKGFFFPLFFKSFESFKIFPWNGEEIRGTLHEAVQRNQSRPFRSHVYAPLCHVGRRRLAFLSKFPLNF